MKLIILIIATTVTARRYSSMFRGRDFFASESNDAKISGPGCGCPIRPYQQFIYIPGSANK